MKLGRLIQWIVGKDLQSSLERKLVLINCIVISIFAIIAVFFNGQIGIDQRTVYLLLITIVVGISFYLITRFYDNYISFLPFFYIMIDFVLLSMFIFNGGIDGPILSMTVLYTLVLITTSPRTWHPYLIGFQSIFLIVLFAIEQYFPSYIVRYSTREQEITDQLFSYAFMIVHSSFSFTTIVRFYQIKNKESKDREIEVQKINQTLNLKNEELESSNFLNGKVFSIISTDLRSPFNSLKAIAYLLRNNSTGEEERKMLTNELYKEVELTSTLMDNLLKWSREKLNQDKILNEKCQLSNEVDQIIQSFKEMVQTKDIKISNHIQKEHFVLTDKESFRLIIRNLISNAIRFSPKGENILISTEKEDDIITITIQDNGLGYTVPTFLETHNNSYRKNQNIDFGEKGNILSLWFSKQFLLSMGSDLKIESKPLIVGTVVSFSLPVSSSLIF